EIDTGVSGRVAQAIGEKMVQIAQHVQVLCITHLPQVAAISDQQYLVEKQSQKQKTNTVITALSLEQRVEVIAQMLEGTKVTTITRQHAAELLQLAHPHLLAKK
ncbi:MAG: DNA repair protein RecN, partial [Bombilactobacillus sp.]